MNSEDFDMGVYEAVVDIEGRNTFAAMGMGVGKSQWSQEPLISMDIRIDSEIFRAINKAEKML